jgi:hypothetical protein
MDQLKLVIVVLCGFFLLVLMARVVVAMAFGSQSAQQQDMITAAWLERQAKDFEERALRCELLRDSEAAEYCRTVSRNYYRRAKKFREAAS